MNVLLLGGTGPIGIHLTKVLSEKGVNVFVTSRKQHTNEANISYIQGNAKEDSFAKDILTSRKWDCVVDFMVYRTPELEKRIDILLGNTSQYIFLSSSRVYADSQTPITEDTARLLDTTDDKKFIDSDEYAICKAREEDVIYKSRYKNFTILRPYITYAENRLPLGVWEKETWVHRLLQNKTLVLPSKFLSCATTICYGRDVANCMCEFIGNKQAIGQVYNITSNYSHKWREILDYYLQVFETITKQKPNVIEVEGLRFGFKGLLLSFLTFGLYKSSRFSPYHLIYDREFNRRFDNSKLTQLLPKCNFTDFQQHLGNCLRVFADNTHYDYTNWTWEAVQDKISGDRTSLNLIPGISRKLKYLIIRYIIPKRYFTR